MCILRRNTAEFNLLQLLVHKRTIQFEMVNYSYIYILPVLTQIFIKAVLFNNLFTDFPIAIKDKM